MLTGNRAVGNAGARLLVASPGPEPLNVQVELAAPLAPNMGSAFFWEFVRQSGGGPAWRLGRLPLITPWSWMTEVCSFSSPGRRTDIGSNYVNANNV